MAKENKNSLMNMEQTMSCGEAMKLISSFAATDRASIMLHGGPGVGKSSIVNQLAEKLGFKRVIDLRLATVDATIVGGIPARHPDNPALMTMLRPDFYPREDEEDTLIFFDEFSNCPPAVQNVALQALLDKEVFGHKFPKSTLVMAAGNRQQDGCFVHPLSHAAANRLFHITIAPTWPDVREYFKTNTTVSQYIISFLDDKPNLLYKLPESKDVMTFPTPRSWEAFGKKLTALEEAGNLKRSIVDQVCYGVLGREVTTEFGQFLDLAATIKAKEVLEDGKQPTLSSSNPSLVFAACGAVVNYFLTKTGTRENNLKEKHITNMMDFLDRVPADFRVKCFMDIRWVENPKHYQAATKFAFDRYKKMSEDVASTAYDRM